MKRTVLALACVIGCASSAEEACTLPEGIFLQRYSRRSGDCPAINDALVRYPADDDDPECTARRMRSQDLCSIEVELSCVNTPYDGAKSTILAKTRVVGEGRYIGVLQLRVEGEMACAGIYDVTVTRQ